MVAVILTRSIKMKSPFLGDRNHLHYRLRDRGLSHRKSVLVMYSISLFFVGMSLRSIGMEIGLIFVMISILLTLLIVFEKFIVNQN